MSGHNHRSAKREQRAAWWQQVMKEREMAGETDDLTEATAAIDRATAAFTEAMREYEREFVRSSRRAAAEKPDKQDN